jgi:PleD family two-component response regulator
MPKTILVAVNDIFFYTKLRDALIPLAYRIERARTQKEVAQKAAALSPSAMVLNLNDPAIDGLKALETVRKDALSAQLPVLAFANHEEVDTWQRAKALGVTKIVSRNEFSARTRDLVEEVISQQLTASSEQLRGSSC